MTDSDETLARMQELESQVGHPGALWDQLQRAIQDDAISKFRDVQDAWLRLMWTLDAYRIEGVPPRGMGKQSHGPAKRLEAVYKSKGNWFATLLALILQNQTSQWIRPRTKVQGFSQLHQIDLAFPARIEDPLVCVETKVTGAPPYGSTPTRAAMADFSNRRKELKFAATDLKLYRRQQETRIEHWGVWREKQPPKTYFLWAARLRTTGKSPEDIKRLISEAQALVNTYLDGAGLFAWRVNAVGDGYESVPVPASAQVTDLDDVLYRIATEIRQLIGPTGEPPKPETPDTRALNVEDLASDDEHE
jgi:hypothetical protein